MRTGPDFHSEHVLRDGSRVALRHIRPTDADDMRRAFQRLSPESRYRRFLYGLDDLSDSVLHYLTDVDGHDHVAIVAIREHIDQVHEEGVGVARFVRLADDPSVAEPAITVIDEMQHKGLGHVLATALACAARERGITHFRGEVLASNAPVRQLLEEAGAVVQREQPESIVFDIPLTEGTANPNNHDTAIARLVRMAASQLHGFTRSPRPA